MRTLLAAALVQFYGFTLVVVRLSGLMIVGPLFGQPLVPANLRVMLVLTMAFVITPTLADHSRILFDKLDANRDGLLTRDEVPESLLARYDRLCESAGDAAARGLDRRQIPRVAPAARARLLEYAKTAVGELGLGFALGLGHADDPVGSRNRRRIDRSADGHFAGPDRQSRLEYHRFRHEPVPVSVRHDDPARDAADRLSPGHALRTRGNIPLLPAGRGVCHGCRRSISSAIWSTSRSSWDCKSPPP